MRHLILIPVMLVFILIPALLAARVYIWTDSQGVKHFSQEPPPENASEVMVQEELRHDPSAEGKQFRNSTADDALSSQQTRIVREGNVILIPVNLSHNGRDVDTLLVLDTGASSTVLTAQLAERLGIQPEINTKVRVAGGELEAQAVVLDSLSVGPHTLREVRTLVLRHPGQQTKLQGALGLNFLSHFPYSIDLQKLVIDWKTDTPAMEP